jgi:hypothetical protein
LFLRLDFHSSSKKDEDIRHVLNVMATKTTASALSGLTFYMVSASWLVKAWPMLSATSDADIPEGINDGMSEDRWRGIVQ